MEIRKINLDEVLFKDKVMSSIRSAVQDMVSNQVEEWGVTILVDGAHGTYIPQLVCALFAIKDQYGKDVCSNPEDEWYWEDFNTVEDVLTGYIREWLGTLYDGQVNVCVGTMEACGDFAIKVYVEEGFWTDHTYCSECDEVIHILAKGEHTHEEDEEKFWEGVRREENRPIHDEFDY